MAVFVTFSLQLLCLQLLTCDLFPFVALLWSHRFRDCCKVEESNALMYAFVQAEKARDRYGFIEICFNNIAVNVTTKHTVLWAVT